MTETITYDPARSGPLDEARIRRALADLGFPGSDIDDEIERAKRLAVPVHVIGATRPTPSLYAEV